MAKIIAPNKQYNGVSASVVFVNGEGETKDPALIAWFKEHGYDVVGESKKEKKPEPEPEKQEPEKPEPEPEKQEPEKPEPEPETAKK